MQFPRLLPLCFVLTAASCAAEGPDVATDESQLVPVPQTANPYTLFETLQVRPLALSPSGKLLFATNTPDNRLEIFRVAGGTLAPIGSVEVGLEPVAVAARSDDEVWVVNHLSDSISIVDVGHGENAHVARTLLVGDEPRDIVFAGSHHDRAFITCAHRGQNTGDAYDLQTPGVGRADVWVFDAAHLGDAAGGQRLTKMTFFADTPRALAASPDGRTVYAAAFASGNQTTVVSPYAVATMYGGHMPGPATITVGGQIVPQPPTALIVKYRNGHWFDMYGTAFDPFVKINLPDKDVFSVDADANPPHETGSFAHVGTTLFNMAVNPKSGKLYVSNTEAHNDVRFEGHNDGFSSVRGHIADNRITVIDPAGGSVSPVNLNPHIDYSQDGNPEEKALSVAFPQDMAISRDGSTLYTVAMGSGKLAIYSTAALDAGAVTPRLEDQVMLSGGGPTGVALDEAHGKAYVLTRFDDSISIVDLHSRAEVKKVSMYNPEPDSVTVGRQYLYDADFTSSHGDSACASCHIGGDKDELSWDLGNPGGIPLSITTLGTVFAIPPAAIIALLPQYAPEFGYNMPLKGPMTTQSLRGMDNSGAMHWRGDRNGAVQQNGVPFLGADGNPVVSAQPNSGIYDEDKAFNSFNVAFPGLVGRDAELAPDDMEDFAKFALQMTYPPNPVRNLDNSLTAEQQQGRDFYFNHTTLANGATVELPSDRFHDCNGCHTLDPHGNEGATAHPGFFGTSGMLTFEFESQIFKVPHLRNLYTKVGMFGSSPDTLQPGTIVLQQGPAQDAIRGFGFNHEGALGQLEHFFTGQVFLKATTNTVLADGTVIPPNPYGIPFVDFQALVRGQIVFVEDGGFALRHAIVAFMMAYDSNEAPIVGQQITLTHNDSATAAPRVGLLEARATLGECDLVAHAAWNHGPVSGFLYQNGLWQPDVSAISVPDWTFHFGVASGLLSSVTYTCAPVGEGPRLALDRDGDGAADGDEAWRGRDPADPSDHP